MKVIPLAGIFFYLCVAAPGQARSGPMAENLLVNGEFAADQVAFPHFWVPTLVGLVDYTPAGGPDGRAAIGLRSDRSDRVPAGRAVTVRQDGFRLAEGETYRLSAYVRTEGFESPHAGVVVFNRGWRQSAGFKSFPADSGWTRMETTFVAFPSEKGQYGAAVYARDFTGTIQVSDIRLEPMSEAAGQGASSLLAAMGGPRLVPIHPLLSHIPCAHPALTFRYFAVGSNPAEALECFITVDPPDIGPQRMRLPKDGNVTVDLSGLACGEYTLSMEVRRSETRERIVEATYPIRIRDIPGSLPQPLSEPMNNLVSVLLDLDLDETPSPRKFVFVNPRNGWVFVSVEAESNASDVRVTLDGQGMIIDTDTDRKEAFRELPLGEHRLTVEGAGPGARLVVRSVPEIFYYPPGLGSTVQQCGTNDWAFMKRHVLPAVTTFYGGRLSGEALSEARALGLKWLDRYHIHKADKDPAGEDPDEKRLRMEQSAGLTDPRFDGIACDEAFFRESTLDIFTQTLWRVRVPEGRRVYTWVVGKPFIPSAHTDFMSSALNVSGGRGRLLYEAYAHAQPDEEAAAFYLDGMLDEAMRRFHYFLPHAAAGTGMIFGIFNQISEISLAHYPEVDFKYYLDMQVQRIATRPDFEGLAVTGYWGGHYADEELLRWAFLLMRHYAVEGNRDLLSDRYGFTYAPGHVQNGDFRDGLTGWHVSAAAEGAVRAETIPGYGQDVQRRWHARTGDTVCLMTRQAGTPNRISQTARGLEPGRAYSLHFVTADRLDVAGKTYNPRRYGIDVFIKGAEVIPGRSFVHIDDRKTHWSPRRDPGHLAKVNVHRVVFRAAASEHTLVFSDDAAVPGEALMINFIQLNPYLECSAPEAVKHAP